MNTKLLPRFFLLVLLALFIIPIAYAQDALTSTQPLVVSVPAGGGVSALYTLADARGVAITALSDSTPPTLTILRGDEVIAANVNPQSTTSLTLNAFLLSGDYTVRVATVDGAAANIILSVDAEVPVDVDIVGLGEVISAQVTPDQPVLLYRLLAVPEPGFLYIENALLDTGARIRIVDAATGEETGSVGSSLLGARLLIAPGNIAYQIEVIQSGSPNPEPFSLCFAPTRADSCETGGAPTPSDITPPPLEATLAPTVVSACTVTPNSSGGANIRQTADVNAPLTGAMPANTSADVIGISPDRTFYNVNYNGRVGWVAASVVTAAGDCASIPSINPPPTLTPTPTPTFTPSPSPTPAGPCVISFASPTFVYTIPTADPSYLFDQAQPGQTYTANGRLSSGGWVRATRSDGVIVNAWIQTMQVLSNGNCNNLPVVSP